jgi:hypothetical protein
MVESGVKHYWPKPILITTRNLDQIDSNDCIVEPQHRISHFLDRDGSRISTWGGGGALKKNAPSGGRREHFLGYFV